ncbi:MAG TPA: nitroreductase family protein [Actinomycetota bacterium]|jgi:coenzyme F420-0:L-glutamate ligase/coenzyme F420-1:gamma-L-glutamate ligase
MDLAEAVAARRSIRSFRDEAVPGDVVERAIALAVQAPAPHHSSPWRFVLIEDVDDKRAFSERMGAAWRVDLATDGMSSERIEHIVGKSHRLLTSTPLLVVCCADMSRADDYPDERRRRAEWSLFAHAVGGALQTFMLALAADGVASCWISAPVFCGDVVRSHLGLDEAVEPHALVLVGYADESYEPRPRSAPDPARFVLRP